MSGHSEITCESQISLLNYLYKIFRVLYVKRTKRMPLSVVSLSFHLSFILEKLDLGITEIKTIWSGL